MSKVIPEFMVIVDLEYVGSVEKWLAKVQQLSELPDDPTFCVQIRAKSAPQSSIKALARSAREVFTNMTVPLSWNGDAEIATSLGYDACHQPEPKIDRLHAHSVNLLHSASIHSAAALARAEASKVDFVVYGPVFQPSWKAVIAIGENELLRIVSQAKVPVLALGGIQVESLPTINQSGAHGIACLSTVMAANDSVAIVLKLQSQWRKLRQRTSATPIGS